MISIIIPTKNRAYTLRKVLPTYYRQKYVNQIIIVNDCSADTTEDTVKEISSSYSKIETLVITNKEQKGAAFCRNLGVEASKNDYILFGEDDAFLADNYTEALLKKLLFDTQSTSIISGRLIFLSLGEDPYKAIKRFGNGNPKLRKTFNFSSFCHIPDAYYENDIKLPLTHALILTKKDLLLKYPFNTNCSKGNAYREESDFQINAYVNGHNILVTNDTHCMHLNLAEVKTGGNRTPILKSLWYRIYYTHYFYKKYYNRLKIKLGFTQSRQIAIMCFVFTQFLELFMESCASIKRKLLK